MSIRFRVANSRSWLHHRGQHALAYDLASALTTRLRKQPCVMTTLTYRRDEWGSPRDLYRAASEERHVRRFMARLGDAIGTSLAGKWICKMEFQAGGWIHWHIIIKAVKHIPHDTLDRVWGYGYVWINRCTPTRLKYFCKYVAKGGDLPEWLYLERSRSIKIIRTSPGFWGRDPVPRSTGGDKMPTYDGLYVTVGQALDNANARIIATDDQGRWCSIRVNPLDLIDYIRSRSHHITQSEIPKWLTCDTITMDQLEKAAERCREAQRAARPLHLTTSPNPPPMWLELAWTALANMHAEQGSFETHTYTMGF